MIRRVSVVVPTRNEVGNIRPLVSALESVLGPDGWEVIFVDDDSPDGTAIEVKRIAQSDARVRCIHRIGRRGLAGACIEGVLSSSAPIVVVMDADLQHDHGILPALIAAIEIDEVDLAIGTRAWGDDKKDLGFSVWRARASGLATQLAQLALKAQITDPMSGFFAIRRNKFDAVAPYLTSDGFKILLDILASSPSTLRTSEVSYTFLKRQEGTSKFDFRAMADFVGLVVNKISLGIVPHRFSLFAIVGGLGVIVHLLAMRAAFDAALTFEDAQIMGTLVAMSSNFLLNNLLTYRDMKLRGARFVAGLLKFYLVCSVGAVANVGFADWVFARHQSWWVSAIAGILVGSIFNYGMSSSFVWSSRASLASRARFKPQQVVLPSNEIK